MRQIVTRLTPLADVRASIEAKVKPVAASARAVADAVGCVLAEDVTLPARPERAIALQDGWALRADDTLGASAYAPSPLTHAPPRIEAGRPMPEGCDCVADESAVRVSGGQAEVLASFAPGDGMLPAGGDHAGGLLMRAGERVSAAQAAALAALGIEKIAVRMPRVVLAAARRDRILDAALDFIAADIRRRGGEAERAANLDAALAADCNFAVVVGGTGSGENDASVAALAQAGQLAVHGIALAPGETSAFGFAGNRPMLLLQGRLDAAVAGWLMLGRFVLDRLTSAAATERPDTLTLARKITSTVGLTELVPVRRAGGQAEPLAGRIWPLSALAQADGYVVISPESEGSSAGSAVRVWPLP